MALESLRRMKCNQEELTMNINMREKHVQAFRSLHGRAKERGSHVSTVVTLCLRRWHMERTGATRGNWDEEFGCLQKCKISETRGGLETKEGLSAVSLKQVWFAAACLTCAMGSNVRRKALGWKRGSCCRTETSAAERAEEELDTKHSHGTTSMLSESFSTLQSGEGGWMSQAPMS